MRVVTIVGIVCVWRLVRVATSWSESLTKSKTLLYLLESLSGSFVRVRFTVKVTVIIRAIVTFRYRVKVAASLMILV